MTTLNRIRNWLRTERSTPADCEHEWETWKVGPEGAMLVPISEKCAQCGETRDVDQR